jgi:hypothetical protein
MSDTIVEQRSANPEADQWAERIAAQQRAGISVKQFCERDLETAQLDLYLRWATIGYHANCFKRMLTSKIPRYYKGPVGTVRHLLTGDLSPSSGFNRLISRRSLPQPWQCFSASARSCTMRSRFRCGARG